MSDLEAVTRVIKEVGEERRSYTERRFNSLEVKIDANMNSLQASVEKLNGHVTWLVRLIIGVVVTSFLGFAVSGGFSGLTG